MSTYIHKAHNVSVLLYHYVCPTKYRKVVFDSQRVGEVLIAACEEISVQYEIHFIEIGEDMDHVHFLIQSVPKIAPTEIARIVKSVTAREIFKRCPEVKKKARNKSRRSGHKRSVSKTDGRKKKAGRFFGKFGFQNVLFHV